MPAKILIADDEAANRTLLEALLGRHSYDVILASDGAEALEKFERIRPDIVLLDVMMPGVDGIEVCRRLKSDPASRLTPVVLVTGLVDSASRLRGIEAGADDFLNKPVDRTELLARMRSLLSLKAYTDELEHAETVVLTLARSIEAKDPYTEGHCERLSYYGARLGERMGLPEEAVTALRRAGVVHDIGKVAIPDSILVKPGPLTPEERTIIERHTEIGERICAPLKAFRLALPSDFS